MKKLVSVLVLGAVALGLLGGCGGKDAADAVPVESVAMITGIGAAGFADSYAGKVVSGETAELKRDADKTVLEVLVAEGDMVKAGDVLFTYDTEAMQLSLDKLRLEKESYDATISAAETEIAELESQRSKASSDQQLQYTLQIDSRRADIREAEYNLALKEKEIAAMEGSMDKTEITSPIAGRVMSVGSLDDGNDMSGGYGYGGENTSDAFITVMDVSAYRVEGHVNELNRGAVFEGMPVIVRSRADETLTWTGVIETIDWEKPVTNTNNNGMYYSMDGGDEMTTSSKYPFYVTLDDNDGLLLGQHVYIEPDLGGGDDTALRLPSWYIVDGGYVWAADGKDRLEKRAVTLGDYDPDAEEYVILAGLEPADYIAFPAEGLAAGQPVTYYDESSFGGGEEFFDEEYYFDEGFDFDGEVYYDEGFDGMGEDFAVYDAEAMG